MPVHISLYCFFSLNCLKKSLYVKYFTSNLKIKFPSTGSHLGLSSVSGWSGISSLKFPSKCQWDQTQKCFRFHSSHQMTFNSYLEATRQTPSSFPGCWKGVGRHCSRGSGESSILFARRPYKRGSEPSVLGLREW